MGYLYLLLEVDKNGNERHKIGITKRNVDIRCKELQTGNSNVISLLKTYETNNYIKLEKWLHGNFHPQKTEADNEWFTLTDDQVTNFIAECKKADEIITFMKENNPFYK
jgi:hypothetical protein